MRLFIYVVSKGESFFVKGVGGSGNGRGCRVENC